jgi:hypothetical protein
VTHARLGALAILTLPLLVSAGGSKWVTLDSTDDFLAGAYLRGVSVAGGAFGRALLQAGLPQLEPTAALPSGRRGSALVLSGRHALVIGGCTALSGTGVCTAFSADVEVAALDGQGVPLGWSATTPLPAGREGLGAVVWGDRLLVVGGRGADGTLGEVLAAPIQSDGTLGEWTVTAVPELARSAAGVFVRKGLLYVVGGTDPQGVPSTDVWRAALSPTGTPLELRRVATLPAARAGSCVEPYGDHLYVVGGRSPAMATSEVLFAPFAADDTLGSFSATHPLPAPLSEAGCFAAAGHLYVLGGSESSSASDRVRLAPIFTDGEVGDWAPLPALPSAMESFSLAERNGVVLLAGGQDAARAPRAETWVGLLDDSALPTAQLGPFEAEPDLPTPVQHGAAVLLDDRIAVAGGCAVGTLTAGCSTFNTDVFSAPLLASGHLGSWTTIPRPIPRGRQRSTGLVRPNALCLLGGLIGTGVSSEVLCAAREADGGLGVWGVLPSHFDPQRYGHASGVDARRVVIAGGANISGTYLNDVQQAELLDDGGLGPFEPLPAFGIPRMEHALWVRDDFLAVITGWNDAPLTDVQVSRARPDGGFEPFGPGSPTTRSVATGALVEAQGYLWLTAGPDVQAAAILPAVGPGAWGVRGLQTPFRRRHAALFTRGRIFVFGGNDGARLTASVSSAPLRLPLAAGSWERLVDLGVPARGAAAMVVEGSFPAGSTARLAYRTASDDGAFSGWSAADLSSSASIALDASAVRFLHLRVSLSELPGAQRRDALVSVGPQIDRISLQGPDPGPGPRRLTVGCACQSGGSALTLVALLALAARRRHRGPGRLRPR